MPNQLSVYQCIVYYFEVNYVFASRVSLWESFEVGTNFLFFYSLNHSVPSQSLLFHQNPTRFWMVCFSYWVKTGKNRLFGSHYERLGHRSLDKILFSFPYEHIFLILYTAIPLRRVVNVHIPYSSLFLANNFLMRSDAPVLDSTKRKGPFLFSRVEKKVDIG